ncbi:MAG: DUF1080 domain-containing protein [Planctomycetaceae bacterium]|nr:DUF1080 domain-containing protein [Planctomycetaceae bacterium]
MGRQLSVIGCVLAISLGIVPVEADEFRPLFNGADLTGWVRVNTAPSTWTVQEGMLICSGRPTGELRTDRMYQNFILELEWRHMVPGGNAGVFVWADDITARGVPFHRSIEVQVLENAYGNSNSHTTHGDIFPIHGTTMKPENGHGGMRAFPTEWRSKPSPEWNHYRITCIDGSISLAVNGKVVTRGHECSLRKGYICLESEGGTVHYRNIRIAELPAEELSPNFVAQEDRGFRSLYSGVDLSGWAAADQAWHSRDWILAADASAATLASSESFGEVQFLFDLRRAGNDSVEIHIAGASVSLGGESGIALSAPGTWDRVEVTVKNGQQTVRVNGEPRDSREIGTPARGPIRITPSGAMEFAGLYVR